MTSFVNGDIREGPEPAPQCPSRGCTIPIDIILRSSDGIRFGAHKKNLEFFSEGFPPAEGTIEKADEIVDLPEKGNILELLLRFMHDTAPPRLSQEFNKWDLDDHLDFIDAADKYGVVKALQQGRPSLPDDITFYTIDGFSTNIY